MMTHRRYCFLPLVIFLLSFFFAGERRGSAQQIGVKTNLLYLATTTPNLGIEFKLADRWTLGVEGSNNPFRFPQWMDDEGKVYNPKLIHWGVMPEAKYWFCGAYERSYLGVHGIYGEYNIGAIQFIRPLREVRYQGIAFGGGLSYGYHWAIGGRWGLELSAGAGFIRFLYAKCDGYTCGGEIGRYQTNYFGPTKLALSLVYFIK